MSFVTLAEAQDRLPELIAHMRPGDVVVITQDQKPVARLLREAAPENRTPRLGTLRGTVKYIAPDFDAPLEDFREYME